MNKQRLFTLILPCALLVFSGALQAQKLTVDDLVNLKAMGFSTQDIQAEIAASGAVEMSAADLDQLRNKGVGPELISSLNAAQAEAPIASPTAPAAPEQTAVAPPPQSAAPAATDPRPEAPAEPVVAPVTPPPAKPAGPAEPEVAKPADNQPPTATDTGTAEDATAQDRPRKRRPLFGASEKQYAPTVDDEFVQPALPLAPEVPQPPVAPDTPAPPAPVPAPIPAPQIAQPPVPAPAPQPAATVFRATPHRMEAGKTAAFNLPYNHTGTEITTVSAFVVDNRERGRLVKPGWLSISPADAVVQPGGSVSFRVELSSVGLSPGTYTGNVRLGDTVSGGNTTIEYPFVLTVTPSIPPAPQVARPMPGPAPVNAPAPYQGRSPAPQPGPSAYRDPWADRNVPIRPYEQPQYGQTSELNGEWAAVIPGAWGMQTILYLEIGGDGSYGYSVLQNNQIIEYSSGRLSTQDGMLQATTDDGELLAYGYSKIGNQLIINMPEWGGNVAFYPQ